MTLNCELCESEFSVLSAKLIPKLSKICFHCTCIWTKGLYSRDLMFWANFIFTIFSLVFVPLFSKDFTDILRIYELRKIYNKMPKYCKKLVLTIITYEASSSFIWGLNYIPVNIIENIPKWIKDTFATKS